MIGVSGRWYTHLCHEAEPKAVAQRLAVDVVVLGLAFRLGRHLPSIALQRRVAVQVFLGFKLLQVALRHLDQFTLLDVARSKRFQALFPNTDKIIEDHWDILSASLIAGFLAFQAGQPQEVLDMATFGSAILIWAAKKAYHAWLNLGVRSIGGQKFREETIAGDGHCQFRALARALPKGATITVGEEVRTLSDDEETRIQELRKAAGDLCEADDMAKANLGCELSDAINDIRNAPFDDIQGGWECVGTELWALATGLGDVGQVRQWHNEFHAKYSEHYDNGDAFDEWCNRQLQPEYKRAALVATNPGDGAAENRRTGLMLWYETYCGRNVEVVPEYAPDADRLQRQLATARWFADFVARNHRDPTPEELSLHQRDAVKSWHSWFLQQTGIPPTSEEMTAQFGETKEPEDASLAIKALRLDLYGNQAARTVLAQALNVRICVAKVEEVQGHENLKWFESYGTGQTLIYLVHRKKELHYNLLRLEEKELPPHLAGLTPSQRFDFDWGIANYRINDVAFTLLRGSHTELVDPTTEHSPIPNASVNKADQSDDEGVKPFLTIVNEVTVGDAPLDSIALEAVESGRIADLVESMVVWAQGTPGRLRNIYIAIPREGEDQEAQPWGAYAREFERHLEGV